MWQSSFQKVIDRRNFVVLDTETTGLEKPAEICEIAIVDHTGAILMSTYVKPTLPIPAAATKIHGITDDMVSGAPQWPAVRDEVLHIIKGADVIVYNATYDRQLMHWSDERHGSEHFNYKEFSTWHCAMLAYAEYYGDINTYYGSYRWQTLTNALLQQGLELEKAHDALHDCLSTLRLVWAITNRL